ncbi:MAG: CBS domain-containing protein [Candidatus Aenigmarchaeota archaeon]|nr:CBS domain-containing protein [Candidatus Aenigmarchaeota archaeon]
MLVNDVMNKNVVVVKKDATIKEASEAMSKMGIGSLVVAENSKLVGMITNNDIVKSVAQEKPPQSTLVEEIMKVDVMSVTPDKTIEEAVDVMIQYKMRQIPVIEEDKIKGILSVTDIAVVEPKLISNIANLLSMQFPGYHGG